jgi:DNA-binding beta-propeller fold protein YncE
VAASKPPAAQAPRFEVAMLWPKPMPNHWIEGSSVGVAVDAQDHVFVLNIGDAFNARTEIGAAATPPTGECCVPAPSVLEFDQSGELVGHWGGPGSGYSWPQTPSGIAIDKQGNVWIAGSGPNDTQILKFSHHGKFLMAAGKAVAPPPMPAPAPAAAPDTAYQGVSGGARGAARGAAGGRGAAPAGRGGRGGRGGRAGPPPTPANNASTESFGGATRISFDAAANEAYVADGSRNRRIAVIDMNSGAIKRFWGAYGKTPSDAATPAYSPDAPASQQFGTAVMCAELSSDGLVYVCDRANDRIQLFKKDGAFVKEQTVMPKTLREGSVSDITFSRDAAQRFLYVADGMNNQVHVFDRQSLALVASFGDGGRVPGEFFALHSIATDSKGNIYTTETYEGKRVQKFTYQGLGPVSAAGRAVLWPTSGGKP